MSDTESSLPLDGWHRRLGARMVPFAGYSMPIQYEGILAEHRWTRESAGLFDVSHMGQLLIAGAGTEKALEALRHARLTPAPPCVMAARSATTRGREWCGAGRAAAEGATAPESLRHKDRADRTLWKEPFAATGCGGPPKG